MDGALEFFEDFYAPNPSSGSLKEFRLHVDDGLSYETPKAFGLPASAEIGYRTKLGEELFKVFACHDVLICGAEVSAFLFRKGGLRKRKERCSERAYVHRVFDLG